MSRWTVNLVATAAVLLIMLVLGQQLSEYWRGASAPASLPNSASTPAKQPANPHARNNAATANFGSQHFSLLQSHATGDHTAAVVELRRLCREAAQHPVANVSAGTPQPAEARLLSLIASETPAQRLGDSTELFEMPGAIPMAVVTKITAATSEETLPGAKVAGPQRRVVIWGIALRTAQRAWVVYAFHPQPRQAGSGPTKIDGSMGVPLPKGAEPILSVQRDGSSVAAFGGNATTDTAAWREFYDRWAEAAGYSTSEHWTDHGGVWRMRWSRTEGATSKQLDIQFGPDGQGGLRGLITSNTDTATGG
ncbi:MAG: hypothetical protein K8T91_17905 [Planctomycetes bacterium]|nr:hypothetical protein [Planctomycetota bacterium]